MIGTLSMEDLARIRRMSRTDAEAFLTNHPTLSIDDKQRVLSLAGKSIEEQPAHIPRGVVYDRSRPKWFVTAWLMGASWRQLAWMHKIAPQTVVASADRVMSSPERQASRLADQMSPDKLSQYRAAYIETDWGDATPVEIAKQLLFETDTDTEI